MRETAEHDAAPSSQFHRGLIVIDCLNVSRMDEERFLRMRAAGVTAANVTVTPFDYCRDTIGLLGRWFHLFEAHRGLIRQVQSVEDIHEAKRQGRVGIILGFQNASPIEDDLNLIEVYHRLGVRVIQLTYMNRNLLGDGCWEPADGGLSKFGADCVREMNRLGILIDLSHVGRRTGLEAIEVSEQPVAITHGNPRAVCDVSRNKSDEEIRAVAGRGGVIGANAFPTFVAQGKEPTLGEYLKHVDYLVELVGVDHVGIGLDFIEGQPEGFFDRGLGQQVPAGQVPQWPWKYPEGISQITDIPNITEGLLQRGYSEEETAKIMGGNFLRLFRKVWQP